MPNELGYLAMHSCTAAPAAAERHNAAQMGLMLLQLLGFGPSVKIISPRFDSRHHFPILGDIPEVHDVGRRKRCIFCWWPWPTEIRRRKEGGRRILVVALRAAAVATRIPEPTLPQ